MTLKRYINHLINKPYKLALTLLLMSQAVYALDSDKNAEFVLDGDNFINLP